MDRLQRNDCREALPSSHGRKLCRSNEVEVPTENPPQSAQEIVRNDTTEGVVVTKENTGCLDLSNQKVGPEGLEPPTKGLCLPTTAFAAPFGFVVWTVSSLYEFAVQSLHLSAPYHPGNDGLGSGLAYRFVTWGDKRLSFPRI